MVWFRNSSFPQVRYPSIPSPVEEDTLKVRDTIGTIFIQGTSIVLPVWRSIMFNDSYLRSCMKLQIVQKIRFSCLDYGQTKACCPGLVSRPSTKAQEPLPRSRGQWQEVVGLLFSPKNSQLVHILSFHAQAVVSLFIFPTGPTALYSEPRGRRYVKNMIHNSNRLYSRAIHSPACMEKHYVQWFILKQEPLNIMHFHTGRTMDGP